MSGTSNGSVFFQANSSIIDTSPQAKLFRRESEKPEKTRRIIVKGKA
jgi:hypothetical protein